MFPKPATVQLLLFLVLIICFPLDIDNAVEERKKMLIRYKEAKELQKEKERRDKEKKGVFKCGLYQQRQPVFANTKVPGKAKVSGALIHNIKRDMVFSRCLWNRPFSVSLCDSEKKHQP